MNDVIYSVGDIHGGLLSLNSLLDEIEADRKLHGFKNPKLIFLGDYIDRGPFSKEVIDLLMSDFMPDYEKIFLMGNHEDMMIETCNDTANFAVKSMWLNNGGWATLNSYIDEDVDMLSIVTDYQQTGDTLTADQNIQLIPRSHIDWMMGLPFLHEAGDYVFVHAGVMPLVPIKDQTPYECMWIRQRFLNHPAPCIKKVVHGHTPAFNKEPENTSTRINLDTCGFVTGRLTAVALHDGEERFIHSKLI